MSSNVRPAKSVKAKPGRLPKPTALTILHGGKPRPKEVVPDAGPVEKPEWLGEEAAAEWDRLAPGLERKGLLSAWDREGFAVYTEASAGRREAYRALKETGTLVEGRNGLIVRNPALQVWRDYAMIVLAAGARFGLTPADRAAMPDTSDPADDKADLFSS